MTTTLSQKTWDTTLPSLNGRRMWHTPAVLSHSLLLMTAVRLFLVPLEETLPTDALQQLEGGANPESVLDARADVLFLHDLYHIELDLNGYTIRLHLAKQVQHLTFRDAESADDFFTKLLHRTQATLTLTSDKPNLLTLWRAPLGLLAGILIATTTLALTVSAAADLVSPPADPTATTHWLNDWLLLLTRCDWRWVTACGGLASGAVQIAMIRRWKQAPNLLMLTRTDSKDPS